MALGLLGRKLGMTQINHAEKGRIAVTLIEVGPCLVMQKKTVEKDGYAAVQLGFGAKKAKRTSKPMMGIFSKLKSDPKQRIREFRVKTEELGALEEGKEITVETLFKEGQLVDILGQSKGKGFAGVVKRWGHAGGTRTHGTHEAFRHGGSLGGGTWPGHVQKNRHMPGQMGNARVTMENLRIVKVLADKNCIAVAGAVPGANDGFVEVVPASGQTTQAPASA